ncbi:MAG: DUF1573 domain-containing protein [Planctomycetes bacterium]|nr:DUF1573 domain-containing protein [Planctomycetota bacterium]
MLQVADALRKIGLEAVGRRETWETLSSGGFPCIVHLTDPDHFVVVSGVEEDHVHLFDGSGRRTTRSRKALETRWGGEALFVRRPPGTGRLPAFLSEPSEPAPAIQFDRLLLDKGTVPAVAEPVGFLFPFRNLGSADLIVRRVRADCKCVDTEHPEEPIPPGGEGVVKLVYHVEAKKGPFQHRAVVETNDSQIPHVVLIASGWSGVEVRINPPRLDLGDVIVGRERLATCFLKYTGDWPSFHADVDGSSLQGVQLSRHSSSPIDSELARMLLPDAPPGVRVSEETQVLELWFVATGEASKEIGGEVSVRTNVPGYERFVLPVRGQIRLPVRVCPSVLDLGDVRPNETVEQTVTLVTRTNEEFEILGVDPGASEMESVFSRSAAGSRAAVTFRATGTKALEWAGRTGSIRVRLTRSGEEVELPLAIAAWPRDGVDK